MGKSLYSGRSGADAPSGCRPSDGAASVSTADAASIPNAEPHLEIRPDSEGDFDEIVARFADGMVHAEMMGDNSCYVGFYWDDGRYCQWWFGARGKLWHNHEDGDGEPPRYTAQGVDRKPWLPDYTASAIEARQRLDPEEGLDPKGESAVGDSRDAQTPSGDHP